jgi:hypothetical protein
VSDRTLGPERMPDPGADVTASEAAAYAFCAKAWHLEHVLDKAPSAAARERRAGGAAEHEAHGAEVVRYHCDEALA